MDPCEDLCDFLNVTGEAVTEISTLAAVNNNKTFLDHAPVLTGDSKAKAIFLIIMAAITVVCNGSMLFSLQRRRNRYHYCLYELLYHLALADILVAGFCTFGDGFWHYTVEWVLGNLACKVFKFSQMLSLYLSTFLVVLVAIDQFLAVRYPLRARSRGSCRRWVGYCWALSTLLSLPQAVIFHVERGPFQEPFFQCVTHNFYTAVWQEQLYTTLSSIFMFLIPLVTLVGTYAMTFWTLHCSERRQFEEKPYTILLLTDKGRQARIRGAKIKSFRISVTITITFLACWTPYYLLLIASVFMQEMAMEELSAQSFFFGMSTSLFNPVIYGLFHVYRPRRKGTGGTQWTSNESSNTTTRPTQTA